VEFISQEQNPLTDYKNNIALKIISNNSLIKALMINEVDFLNHDIPDDFDPIDLLHEKVYPYRFIPEVLSSPESYITMSFGDFKYIDNEFKSGKITFFIFSHKSLLRTHWGLRYDFMSYQIDKMFNKKYGIGDFNLVMANGGGDLVISDNYYGSVMPYEFTEFQIKN